MNEYVEAVLLYMIIITYVGTGTLWVSFISMHTGQKYDASIRVLFILGWGICMPFLLIRNIFGK